MVGGSNGKKDFFVSVSLSSVQSAYWNLFFNCGCVTARVRRMVRTLGLVSLYWFRCANCS